MVDEVGDDARDERFERRIPSELLRVHGAVALDHPAEIARARGTEHDDPGEVPGVEDLLERGHRGDRSTLFVLPEPSQENANLLGRAVVQLAERRPALVRQSDRLSASVLVGTLAGYEAPGFEPTEDPAEVAGVDVERCPKFAHLRLVPLGELEHDASLGEGVPRVEEPFLKEAEHVGVHAVEAAHGRNPCFDRRLLHASAPGTRYLTESRIDRTRRDRSFPMTQTGKNAPWPLTK